jgi:hypothetical protein
MGKILRVPSISIRSVYRGVKKGLLVIDYMSSTQVRYSRAEILVHNCLKRVIPWGRSDINFEITLLQSFVMLDDLP